MKNLIEKIKKEAGTPTGYHISVLVDELAERKTASGIIISDDNIDRQGLSSLNKYEAQVSGIVLDKGPDCYDKSKEHWCDIGDHIRFQKYNGDLYDVMIEDEDGKAKNYYIRVIPDDSVRTVLEKNKEV